MRSLLKNSAFAVASFGISLAVVAFADPAHAERAALQTTGTSVLVRIRDLDVRSPAGLATAERRIRDAAEMACGSDDRRDLEGERCRHDAIGSAHSAISPRIAAL